MKLSCEKILLGNLILTIILYPCILLPISLKMNFILLQPIALLIQIIIVSFLIIAYSKRKINF